MKEKSLISVLFIALCSVQCDPWLLGPDETQVTIESNLATPALKNDGLQVSSPAEQGVDPEILERTVRYITDNNPSHIHSVLIVRHNKLLLESYFDGWNDKRRHDLRSATKSFTSCLVGIAIDQKIIPGTNTPVYSYFNGPESFANPDDRKTRMTIRNFLEMRTGLDCNDEVSASPGNEEKMYEERDWSKFILDLPAAGEPGTRFSYCTGSPVVLGNIVARASGRSVPDFADTFLFSPLGITDYQWESIPNGDTDTGGHLHLYPRDMAKFGMLYLNNGKWNGAQIVSQEWVHESTLPRLSPYGNKGEGYAWLWWTVEGMHGDKKLNYYYANGNGGQLIFVIPDLDAVIVFTGGNFNARSSTVKGIMGLLLSAFGE
ncbi:MAG TPA: serine hydrolase [Cyclobacteriaceae bacterium]|nr:serine hydrolase [Cyclobacteriaceae bacterium]